MPTFHYHTVAHGCQNSDISLKLKGLFDTIFMLVKIGDDPISSLDISFIGGVSLREKTLPLNIQLQSFFIEYEKWRIYDKTLSIHVECTIKYTFVLSSKNQKRSGMNFK